MAISKGMTFMLLISNVLFITPISSKTGPSKCYPEKKQNCVSPNEDDVSLDSKIYFFLFTRSNPVDPEMLHMCNGWLPEESHFDPQKRLYVFIPGFMFGICKLDVLEEIKNEWLLKDDVNVLLIDLSEEYGVDYIEAVANFPKTAAKVIKVLRNIQMETGLESDKIDLIGHSLGAQLAGLIGRELKVRRITGLDPAGPSFEKDSPEELRLDPQDAALVDIIHCNGGQGIPYLGIAYPAGDVDFYVNGGADQPNCKNLAWKALKKFNFLFAIGTSSIPYLCSHAVCLEYYKLTINNRYGKFLAWSCDNYASFKSGNCSGSKDVPVIMGYDFEESFGPEQKMKSYPRKYYIQTFKNWPFVTEHVETGRHPKTT